MKLLEEMLSDYPRLWEFYRNRIEEKTRGPKFSQRYPMPMGTLSLMVDFHNWTHATTNLVSEQTGLVLDTKIRKTGIGPCPTVLYRLSWLNNNWATVETKRKSLARTLGDEIVHWHTRIRVKVNDGDFYTYDSSMVCDSCQHASVVVMNDMAICVNIACRNTLTGEWRKWQINLT